MPRMIPVGKVTRTHGVRGAVKIYPYGDSLAVARAGAVYALAHPSGRDSGPLTLRRVQVQGRLLIAEFEEIAGMDEAESLIGAELLIAEDHLPPTEEGEYYQYQLIGLTVMTVGGDRVGQITGILETPASDVYVVDRGGSEVLIPAVEEMVREVSLEGGVVVVDLPEGLVDDL